MERTQLTSDESQGTRVNSTVVSGSNSNDKPILAEKKYSDDEFDKEKTIQDLKDAFYIINGEYEQANITAMLAMKKVIFDKEVSRVE